MTWIMCAALVGVSLTALAGCGKSSKTTSSPASTVSAPKASSSETAGASRATGLGVFLLGSHDEPGFTPSTPATASSVDDWGRLINTSRAAANRLRAEKFVKADLERLGGGSGAGISFVMRFASSTGAHQEEMQLAGTFGGPPGTKVSRFAVPGVKGAIGIGASGGGHRTGVNVAWVDGRCFALVGNLSTRPVAIGVFAPPLVAAVRTIYRRSAGHCH